MEILFLLLAVLFFFAIFYLLKRITRRDKKAIIQYLERMYSNPLIDEIVHTNPNNVDWFESLSYPLGRYYSVTIRLDEKAEPKLMMICRSASGSIHIEKTLLQKQIKN